LYLVILNLGGGIASNKLSGIISNTCKQWDAVQVFDMDDHVVYGIRGKEAVLLVYT
jgi:hypothetical protein